MDTLLISNHLVPLFQIGAFSQDGSIEYVLELATGIFSLVLFAITLYAWWQRGRQPTLLIVSFAFLAFFSKQLIEILPLGQLHGELFSSVMDFLTLVLFFIALVVRPRRKGKERPEEPTNN